MASSRSSSRRCHYGKDCMRSDCRFFHPEGRTIDGDYAAPVYHNAQTVPVLFSPRPSPSPSSWPDIEERLRRMQDGETVIFIDGDNNIDWTSQKFIRAFRSKMKTDFLVITFFGAALEYQKQIKTGLNNVLFTETLTPSQEAADINLSMLAALADKYLLPKGIPLLIVTTDGFAAEATTLLRSMNSGREIRWLTAEMFRQIIESERINISELGKEVRNFDQVEIDFEKQCHRFIHFLYKEYIAGGINSVLKSRLMERMRYLGVFWHSESSLQLQKWAENEKFITLQECTSSQTLEVVIAVDKVKKYCEGSHRAIVPQSIPQRDPHMEQMKNIEDKFRCLTTERVIFIDEQNTHALYQAIPNFHLLDKKGNFVIVAFIVGAAPVDSQKSNLIFFAKTATRAKTAQYIHFAMVSAIANKMAPLTSSFTISSFHEFAIENVARLREMQPKRVIELSSDINQIINMVSPSQRSAALVKKLPAPFCFVCGRNGAGHGYWECPSKDEPTWKEKTLEHRKEYDLLIDILKKEFLDKKRKDFFGLDLLDAVKKKLPETRSLAFPIERALIQGVLITSKLKRDWRDTAYDINQEKLEEYISSSVSVTQEDSSFGIRPRILSM